jgi:DNA-binding Xre family transcriptional regulator
MILNGVDFMAYSYKKLWKLLIDKNMMKKDLMELTKINSSTIAKMGRGEAVSLDVLGRICEKLNCNIGDLVDFVIEEKN